MSETQALSASTELVPAGGDERVAYHLYKSGFFKADLKGVSQGVTKIILGRSLGIDPASAVMGLFISGQGKLTMSANLMARCIKSYRDPLSGHQKYRYRILEHTDKVCSIQVWEWVELEMGKWKWEETGPPVRVTVEQFKHLAGNQTWKAYPTNMLFARCISNVAKFHCADVFGGSSVYTPDEVPNSGVEVDGETLEVKSYKAPPEVVEVEFVPSSQEGPNAKKLKEVMAEMGLTFKDLADNFGQTEESLKALSTGEEGAGRLVGLLAFKKGPKKG